MLQYTVSEVLYSDACVRRRWILAVGISKHAFQQIILCKTDLSFLINTRSSIIEIEIVGKAFGFFSNDFLNIPSFPPDANYAVISAYCLDLQNKDLLADQ